MTKKQKTILEKRTNLRRWKAPPIGARWGLHDRSPTNLRRWKAPPIDARWGLHYRTINRRPPSIVNGRSADDLHPSADRRRPLSARGRAFVTDDRQTKNTFHSDGRRLLHALPNCIPKIKQKQRVYVFQLTLNIREDGKAVFMMC